MASSNNALWIGAIVIVAALTAVELMSSRDDADTAESTDGEPVAGSPAPVSPQSDAGQIAMGTADAVATADLAGTASDDDESAHAEPMESGFQFDTESEFASDLIVDLDRPEAHVAAITENPQNEPEADNTEDILIADLPTDDAQATEAESIAVAPVETAVQSTEETTVHEPAQTEAADDSSPVHPVEQVEAEETPAHAAISSDISQHLAAAKEAIKALRMTTPSGDNAYEHYQAVLAIDPNNAEAHAGIDKMVDMYIYFIEKAIAEDEINTARVYLQRAKKIQPDSAKLKNLHAELD